MFILNFARIIIAALLRTYEILLIARALLSWFPMLQLGGIVELLHMVTEPLLAPIRSVLWKIPFLQGMPIDFSVLVAFLLIDILRSVIL